jgi:ADP-ribose pyrophosphatase
MKYILFCLLVAQTLCADYFSVLKQINRENGDYKQGEIEVVLDPAEIAKIQKVQEERLLKKGFTTDQAAEFSRIGIVNEDQYWIWLRDAVLFPKGIPGTYDRLIWKSELSKGHPGVAVLPVLPSGKIVLNLNYRHATRSWELELPRGIINSEETLEDAAFRELKEETGLVASKVDFLGNITPDSGVLSSIMPVFMGRISSREESNHEYSEAIADVIAFTKEELKEGLIQGYLEVEIQGKKRQVPLRDSFLTFALYQAEIRKLL